MKPIVFETVSLAEAKRVHDRKTRATTHDWSIRRAPVNETESLRPATLHWAVVKEISDLTAHYAALHPPGRPWT